METTTISGIIGIAGTLLGVVVTKTFELLLAKRKAALDREDYTFRFFFDKRAEFLLRLFEIYAESHSQALEASLLERDPIAVFKAYQPVGDFLRRGFIYPSAETVLIALRFQQKEIDLCRSPEEIVLVSTKTYQDLKNAIRAELGEKYFPEKPLREKNPPKRAV